MGSHLIIVDGWAKESEKHIAEIVFLKAEIKGLVDAIRAATNKSHCAQWNDGKNTGPRT